MNTTNFDDLIGKVFDFYGVDGNFMKLDNEIWEVVEDESDGYRSLLDTVRKLPINGIFFQTPIARVRIDYVEEPGEYGDENHFYKLIDIEDNHEWLKFGTENINDYYPCFRFEYQAKEARINEAP